MATITDVNGRFKARVRKAGQSQTKTFASYAEADNWAKAIEGRLVMPQAAPSEPSTTLYAPERFNEVLKRYLTEVTPQKKSWRNEKQFIQQLLRDADWVKIPLRRINLQHLKDWRDSRLKVVSPASVSRQYDVVKAAARLAASDWDWNIPVEMFMNLRIAVPPQSDKFRRPTQSTLDAVMWSADQAQVKWLRPVIEFALETAMRRSEIIKLQWYDVDLDNAFLRVADGKNGYDRTIALSPRAVELLKAQTASNDGSVWGITVNQLYMAWKRCKKRAAVDMRFHDLRHEAASRFFELGFTPIEVATMTGHKTMSQVMRYSHADLHAISGKWGQ